MPTTSVITAPVCIRAFSPGDAERVHAVHYACLDQTLLGRYTPEQIGAWKSGRSPEGYLKFTEAGRRILVAEVDGDLVGFAMWDENELISLFVRPDAHRRSIGSRLLAACCQDAEALGRRIEKVKAAIGADAFYARHGFKAVGTGATTKIGIDIPDIRMVRDAEPSRIAAE